MLSPEEESRIEALLTQLTLDEKVALSAGIDAWHTCPVPRLGIPSIKLSDGPNGVRGDGVSGATSACFPVGTALGASWNPELVRRVGAAMAEEARRKGVQVVLGPTINIHRHPLSGRNFECYGEDPYLAGQMAVHDIDGVQGKGVIANVKHYVGNDQETNRFSVNDDVDERTLREIYLPPFEAAVRRAGVWALMTAYNRINGLYACDHAPLLHDLLEGEWGFDGLVMSDWWGTQSTVAAANAGLDLEMPGPARFFGPALREAVAAGEVSEATLDEKVRRLLRLALRTGALDDSADHPETSVDDPADRSLIREAAAEGMVLLTNRDAALPLDAG